MKMKFLLLLSLMFTSLSVFSQKAENKSNPYGIWTGLNVKPQDADYIRGRFIWRKWCDLRQREENGLGRLLKQESSKP